MFIQVLQESLLVVSAFVARFLFMFISKTGNQRDSLHWRFGKSRNSGGYIVNILNCTSFPAEADACVCRLVGNVKIRQVQIWNGLKMKI